jgi:hypothetical protein
VRVLGMWAAGVPDTLTPEKLAAAGAGLLDEGAMQALHDQLDGMRILRRSPRLAEIAATATFLASDMASALTGTFVNATGMFPSQLLGHEVAARRGPPGLLKIRARWARLLFDQHSRPCRNDHPTDPALPGAGICPGHAWRVRGPEPVCERGPSAASYDSCCTTALPIAISPWRLGCTGAAGDVGASPSIHFCPGSWQTSWPIVGV